MRVAVTFRHMEATDALRDYAEEKVRHAERLVRNAIDAHVVLSVTKRRHLAEITLQADHETFNATEETGDLYSAIDQAVAKLERQLRKHTTKRDARKHSPAPEGADLLGDEPRQPRAQVPTEQVAIELLSVPEALSVAEHQQLDALIFRESNSQAVLVLYRKKDGSFALLEPEGI